MDIKTQTIINEIAHQRNQFQDAVAMLSGDLAEARATIAQQEEKIAALNTSLANQAPKMVYEVPASAENPLGLASVAEHQAAEQLTSYPVEAA